MALSGAISAQITYRSDSATGPQFWANRLEISAPAGGLGIDPALVAAAIVTGFRPLLLGNFWLERVTLSTYAPDSRPYNPETLYVLPVNLRGLRAGTDPANDALPITNVLFIRKLVATGRLGRLFLRGLLREVDITADNNGGVSLVDASGIQDELDDALQALNDALGGAANLALISGQGLILSDRPVTGLGVAGVTYKSLRTRRKTRLVQSAAATLGTILQDGLVGVEEIPALVDAARTVVQAIGVTLPPLLPAP